jgi:hypothetical protein
MASELASKRPVGRPSKMNAIALKKLEEAFAIGASDGEACFYADISTVTLYAYQQANPEFLNRKNALKERPVLLARQTVLKDMDNPLTAKWYLERKKKGEFATRTDLTSGDEPITFSVVRNITPPEITEGEIVE